MMRWNALSALTVACAAMLALPAQASSSTPVAAPDVAPDVAPERAELARCLDGGAVNNAQFQQCYTTAIAQADERMATRWNALLTRLAPSPDGDPELNRRLAEFATQHRDALIAEQVLWTAFRTKACAIYWDEGLGSMHRSIVGPQCIFSVVEQRIVQIDDYLENLEVE